MDWKRVKSILIGMLLLTNLILAASIYSEFTANARAERQAVRAAIEFASAIVSIDESVVLALPAEIYEMSVTRELALETAFAQGLLGAGTASESGGGGIYRFEGPGGRGEIKRGGEIAFELTGTGIAPTAEYFANLLGQAGLEPIRAASVLNGHVKFEQLFEGLPVLDYVLDCTETGISGRWLISGDWVRIRLAPARAELVIRLALLARERGVAEINSISCAYYIENTGGQDSAALPVWIVGSSGGTFIYDLVGERVIER